MMVFLIGQIYPNLIAQILIINKFLPHTQFLFLCF